MRECSHCGDEHELQPLAEQRLSWRRRRNRTGQHDQGTRRGRRFAEREAERKPPVGRSRFRLAVHRGKLA